MISCCLPAHEPNKYPADRELCFSANKSLVGSFRQAYSTVPEDVSKEKTTSRDGFDSTTPTALFDYELPLDRIAHEAVEPRDAARLLVVHRKTACLTHHTVRDLPDLLREGDLLVVNDTRVIPARLIGRKPTGGRVELLLVEEEEPDVWLALLGGTRRLAEGTILAFSESLRAEVLGYQDGQVRVRLHAPGDAMSAVNRIGVTPLPPYIKRPQPREEDRERYQTVYARHPGAVAAPTAGLHFTQDLFNRLSAMGIRRADLTLHVGPGTFRPVRTETLEEHRMEEERFFISEATVAAMEETKKHGGRVVAVGTTVVRVLETAAKATGTPRAIVGRTDLFIRPPFHFQAVDVLLTNFHLPRSTLLALVCAFGGRELILKAYAEAVRLGYRFYSYGDAMLIL